MRTRVRADSGKVVLLGTWVEDVMKDLAPFTIQTQNRRLRDGQSRVRVTAYSGALGSMHSEISMGVWALSHPQERTSVAHWLLAPYSALSRCQPKLTLVATLELVGQSVVA